jgi:hypothetical protein
MPTSDTDLPGDRHDKLRDMIYVMALKRLRDCLWSQGVALHLTVVTSTTAQSGVASYARDAHVASEVSSAAAAHGTPTILAPSSNGR